MDKMEKYFELRGQLSEAFENTKIMSTEHNIL